MSYRVMSVSVGTGVGQNAATVSSGIDVPLSQNPAPRRHANSSSSSTQGGRWHTPAPLTRRSYRVTWAVCATGHQAIKLKIVKSLASLDLEWVTMVHPRAIVDPSSIIGKGALLGPGVIVQHNCSIGEFSFIGDNVCLGMFATVSPYVTCQMGANLVDESQVCHAAGVGAAGSHNPIPRDVLEGARGWGSQVVAKAGFWVVLRGKL